MLVFTNTKDTHKRPTVKFPNNATMNVTKTRILTISRSLSTHAKKAHIFDVLHSASLISLGKICGNDCVTILDNNNIIIFRDKKLI